MLQYVFRTAEMKRVVDSAPAGADFITITLDFTCDSDKGTFPATVIAQSEIITAATSSPVGERASGCPRPPGCPTGQLVEIVNSLI